MRVIFIAVLCAASMACMTLAPPAVAQQKTAKQCNDEWTADKAAIQASGKTKRVFVAECRGLPVAAPKPVTLGKGQYATETEAKYNYARNIQIADLNALNAILAVIKWKKLFGFYVDLEREHHSTYTINGNVLMNEDSGEA